MEPKHVRTRGTDSKLESDAGGQSSSDIC